MRTNPLPPLPATVFSAYGPIAVELVEDLRDAETKETLFGYWNSYTRTIQLRAGMCDVTSWLTLWHERTHADLDYIGIALSPNQAECVCNAVAQARVTEMLATP